jgi:hypothetical protein
MNDMTPTILTIEGDYFDFTAPEKWSGSIETVAHALANICRFNGHTKRFYSVAQHCVLMSYIVPPEHALHALMHEAGEPFCGDMSAPLKMLLPEYKAIEKRVEAAVLVRFGLAPQLPPCIKAADHVLLATEQRDMMNRKNAETWTRLEGVEPLKQRIRAWPIFWARWRFLWRYRELLQLHQQARAAKHAQEACAEVA